MQTIIVDDQGFEVDSISRATISSNAIKKL
ncbi:FMN-binding protein [Clostridium amazonitimonense]